MSPYAFIAWAVITVLLAVAVGSRTHSELPEGMRRATEVRIDTPWNPQRTQASAWVDSVLKADKYNKYVDSIYSFDSLCAEILDRQNK